MPGSFYGWYLKCQSDSQTLAIIPAVHGAGANRTCSIQFITENDNWTVDFPGHMFYREGSKLYVGESCFGEEGIELEIHGPKLEAEGHLQFGPLTRLKYDIMGPFAAMPYMECRHSIWSMKHSVNGKLQIAGKEFVFENAAGYWEGDRGKSFPKRYVWTQCCFADGALTLAAADVPIGRRSFTGVIGVVLWKGKQYRFATYLGAKAVQLKDGLVRVRQGDMELEACLMKAPDRPLKAPNNGDMTRIIRESVNCRTFYRFKKGGQTIFDFETDRASFEYEYPL